jgi:CheY-like chemotaxis protein
VELHGGSVRAESEGPGRGARFIVTLPLSAGQGDGETGRRGDGKGDAGILPVAPSFSLPLPRLDGVRVLVVDDEPDARELVERILAECGAVIRAEAGTAAAERALAEFSPQVLVSDIGMPEEDGYMLIRRIRTLPPEQGGRIPAAALTAFAGAEDRRRALQAGFQMHVPKPIDARELVAVVAQLAGRN